MSAGITVGISNLPGGAGGKLLDRLFLPRLEQVVLKLELIDVGVPVADRDLPGGGVTGERGSDVGQG